MTTTTTKTKMKKMMKMTTIQMGVLVFKFVWKSPMINFLPSKGGTSAEVIELSSKNQPVL